MLVLMLGLGGLPAGAAEPVRVGLFDMPPYYSQRADGQPEGYLIETLDKIMTQLNLEWQPHFSSVNDMLKGIATGELDLVMLIRHPLLKEQALYGHQPIDRITLKTYFASTEAMCSNLASMRGQRVVLLKGYGYGGLLNQLINPANGLKVRVVDSHHAAFNSLISAEADCVLDYERPATRTISELGLTGIQSHLLREQPVYFVTSQRAQRERQLLDALDAVTVGLH